MFDLYGNDAITLLSGVHPDNDILCCFRDTMNMGDSHRIVICARGTSHMPGICQGRHTLQEQGRLTSDALEGLFCFPDCDGGICVV